MMNPRLAREQIMLPAILLATVIEQKQHRHACGGANGQPEKRLAGIGPESRGENLHHAPNVNTNVIEDCGLRIGD
jgi:hypothetical protein